MPVPKAEVLELMRMDVDPAEIDEIRELWKEHSKAEDNRSIEGLLATLSDDCVYTVYPDDVSWHGHEGAARFYTELLTAFPDILFELQNIVIGPQGVVEEAIVTGTHSAKWLDAEPTGERMTWRNAIFFPWDREARRFAGERVYTDIPRRLTS
jgi:predicted ester cyclase